MIEILRIVFSSIYLLFLPGFCLSYVIFRSKEVDLVERLALSFGLSVSAIPLLIFSLNFVFKVKINLTNIFFEILTVIGISLGVIVWRKNKLGSKKNH